MAEMPDSPSIRRFQTFSTPRPRGQAMPMPVTTTRRIVVILAPNAALLPAAGARGAGNPTWTAPDASVSSYSVLEDGPRKPGMPGTRGAGSGRLLLLDIVDRILHGANLFGGVLGDLHAERLLEGHHQLDRVQAVRAQVVDEGRLRRDLAFLDAEVLDHDLLNPVGDVAHRNSTPAGTVVRPARSAPNGPSPPRAPRRGAVILMKAGA